MRPWPMGPEIGPYNRIGQYYEGDRFSSPPSMLTSCFLVHRPTLEDVFV